MTVFLFQLCLYHKCFFVFLAILLVGFGTIVHHHRSGEEPKSPVPGPKAGGDPAARRGDDEVDEPLIASLFEVYSKTFLPDCLLHVCLGNHWVRYVVFVLFKIEGSGLCGAILTRRVAAGLSHGKWTPSTFVGILPHRTGYT